MLHIKHHLLFLASFCPHHEHDPGSPWLSPQRPHGRPQTVPAPMRATQITAKSLPAKAGSTFSAKLYFISFDVIRFHCIANCFPTRTSTGKNPPRWMEIIIFARIYKVFGQMPLSASGLFHVSLALAADHQKTNVFQWFWPKVS